MNKFAQIFTIILIFGVFFAFPASAQERSAQENLIKAELRNRYMPFLDAGGYHPEVDAAGDIEFTDSGRKYYIIIDADNPWFFRIYTGVILNRDRLGSFSSEDALFAASLDTANKINMQSRVAKVYISSDRRSVAINVELILPDMQDFDNVLKRALSCMWFAESNFFTQLRAAPAP